MAVYGYARCSTNEGRQDIDRQKRELKKLGVENDKQIYWEYGSGIKTDRDELEKLMAVVKQGDTIATTEVSRLTRSTKQLCEILQFVRDNKLQLNIGGSFVVDCRTDEIDPMTKGMIMMWGVFSEMERDIISQRVKSGMENAKLKGKRIGRPEVTRENLPDRFWKYYSMVKAKQISVAEASRLLECQRATFYRYMSLAEANDTEGIVRKGRRSGKRGEICIT